MPIQHEDDKKIAISSQVSGEERALGYMTK
jgi:hypothetical protein